MATTKNRVREYSVCPHATVDLDPDDPRLDRLLDALIAHPGALGVGGVAYVDGDLSSTFQVAVVGELDVVSAAHVARAVLADALEAAGITADVTGLAVVDGSDPDRLPW